MQAITRIAARILTRHAEVRRELARRPEGATRDDITAQLDNLVFTNFISATADPWYGHLPRYVKAISVRLEAAATNPSRDRQAADLVEDLEADYAGLCNNQPPGPLSGQVEEIGFLIEELRVQQFAQQLRTAVSVSPKRIRKAMADAR